MLFKELAVDGLFCFISALELGLFEPRIKISRRKYREVDSAGNSTSFIRTVETDMTLVAPIYLENCRFYTEEGVCLNAT